MPERITVAEAMGDEPHVDVVKQIEPPRHNGQPPFPAPGIYFGMPDEEYHAIHACSASGLKHLSVSSMDYWAMSVLNQEKEDEATRDSGSLTPRQLGHAYHTYIVEGPAVFNQRYAVALDKDTERAEAKKLGVPFCVTTADLRVAITDAGGVPKGTLKEPLIDQLLDFIPTARVWDRMVAKHAEDNDGKLLISAKLHRRIAIANAMILGDPQLKGAFSGGHAEVSIFWYCPTTGAPMKARLDYLKMNHLIDLKSFSNMMNKPVQRAIDMAIANQKYFIPVVVYLEAIAAAKQMVKDGKGVDIYVCKKVATEDGSEKMLFFAPDKELVEWCWQWAHQPEPEVIFIFQQTGVAPVTRGRIMGSGSAYVITLGAVQFLKKKWVRCATAYGTDPWVDFEPVTQTEEETLPWAATDFGDTE